MLFSFVFKKNKNKSTTHSLHWNDLDILVVRKSHYRNFKIKVNESMQIKVFCSIGISEQDIFLQLEQHKEWLYKAILKIQTHNNLKPKWNFQTGDCVYFLGHAVRLKVQHIAASQQKVEMIKNVSGEYELHVFSSDLKSKTIQKLLQKYYLSQAKLMLPIMVNRIANKHGFKINSLKLKLTKSRWGSCSVDASICLNWALLVFSEHIIEYVIIHELCHLKHMNHSAQFWNLVEEYLPDFKMRKNVLRKDAHKANFLYAIK